MNQVWNIFRKDARHHWPEILVSLAILVAFAWVEIRSWGHFDPTLDLTFVFARFLPGLVNVLVPLSWIFLIVRVVQGETLVGDRQFWVTRPYDWKVLLAAKALFVLAFIHLPLFLMDAFLLSRAGFHPENYVVGLLWMQLMWIPTLFLFACALAAIAKNLPQMLVVVLFVVLYIIGLVAISQVVPDSDYSPGSDWWMPVLLDGTAIVVLFLQYSRRRTGISRWLVAAALLTFGLIVTFLPYRSLILRAYPVLPSALPGEFTLLPPNNNEGTYLDEGEDVSIRLPLSLSQLPKDAFVELNGMIATLTNASGFRWDSGWKGQYLSFYPDQKSAELSFEVKHPLFDKLKSFPVSLRLLLALTTYHDKNQREFVVPKGKFSLPDVGICSADQRGYWYSIRCQAPLRTPKFLLITSEMAASTCLSKKEIAPIPGLLSHGSVRGGDSDPAEMGISPIHQVDIYLSGWDVPGTHIQNPGICPGTPLTLSNPQAIGHSRVELQFDNLSLTDYQKGGGRIVIR